MRIKSWSFNLSESCLSREIDFIISPNLNLQTEKKNSPTNVSCHQTPCQLCCKTSGHDNIISCMCGQLPTQTLKKRDNHTENKLMNHPTVGRPQFLPSHQTPLVPFIPFHLSALTSVNHVTPRHPSPLPWHEGFPAKSGVYPNSSTFLSSGSFGPWLQESKDNPTPPGKRVISIKEINLGQNRTYCANHEWKPHLSTHSSLLSWAHFSKDVSTKNRTRHQNERSAPAAMKKHSTLTLCTLENM